MVRKRRRFPVELLHFLIWLVLNRARIRGFQFGGGEFHHHGGVGVLVNFRSCCRRYDDGRRCGRAGDGARAARPRGWGRLARSHLSSIASSSSRTDGADARSPSLASSMHASARSRRSPSPTTAESSSAAAASRPSSSSSSSPAFYDQAILHVRAGSGGSGATSFELLSTGGGSGSGKRKPQQGAPNGGSGGRGGHVVLHVDPDLNTLAGLAARQGKNLAGAVVLRAENGRDGQARKRSGAPGRDVVLRVPPGTIVEELVANQDEDVDGEEGAWVELGRLALADQTRDPSTDADPTSTGLADSQVPSPLTLQLIIGRGGRGGDGNSVYASAAASRRRGSPKSAVHREGPAAGERKVVRLTLQFLADAAIVGMPNAGKSTFLAAVTRAKPKIANYAFTTIVPNLGVWINDEDDPGSDSDHHLAKLVLCDVPGLVQGASQGVGLGHEFLRHVERCSILVHLVDGTSPTAVEDYQMINRELAQYAGGMLASKPQVVIVNKLDLLSEAGMDVLLPASSVPASDRQFELQEALLQVMPHSRLLWMSAKEKQGVEHVMRRVASFVHKVNEAAAAVPEDAAGT